MKRLIKNLILIILFMSLLSPIISGFTSSNYPNMAQETSKSFVCGTVFGGGDWDPPIYISTPNNYYLQNCLESLVWTDFDGDSHPVLATNWTIYPRPDEGGHTGGVKAIAFSLRQGVEFHDGSEWNATVAEWNLDRNTIISGNLSGKGDRQNQDLFWFDASQWDGEFTPNWDLSWYKYDLFGLGTEIPIINQTEIINPYLINITFNTWTNGLGYFEGATFYMISMESYSDWYDTPIYGIGEHPEFPQNNPAIFPGHMIGTGPYIFDFIDEAVTATGHVIKNDNYWNNTALEANELHSISDVYIRHYADFESRTTAILTGEIDYIADLAQIPITDHEAIIEDPLLDYVPVYLDPGIVDITFKCEEGLNKPCYNLTGDMAWANGLTPKEIFEVQTGFTLPDGVNRTVRRALSYSFDYDTFFNVVQGGWGNLTHSCLGLESIYYNPSIPEPYYNVTRAREILLSDPYYAGEAAKRGLSLVNSTTEWRSIASSDPIGTHNMIYTIGSEMPVYMQAALNDIGFSFIGYSDPDIWQNQVATGGAILYDMFPFLWPNSATNPWPLMNAFFTSNNRVIPYYGYNFAFLANDTIDNLFTQIFFSEDPQPLFDQLANDLQNYHVPFLYLSQYQQGFGINIGWHFTELMPERIGFSGLPYYAWIGGERITTTEPPFIPGYDVTFIVFISIIAIFSTIYVMMKKKGKFQ
ncbi:MAG: ABC transporter substrate-binding protein [Candidatus Hodarchaeota archaeon]